MWRGERAPWSTWAALATGASAYRLLSFSLFPPSSLYVVRDSLCTCVVCVLMYGGEDAWQVEHLDAAGRRQPLTAPRNLCFYLGPARAGEETPSETSKDDDFDAKASKPQDLSEKWDGWPIGAGKDVLQGEEEKEGAQRRRGELSGGRQKVMMVTWMPPVHHITGMSERLWQVAQALVSLGFQVVPREVHMQP